MLQLEADSYLIGKRDQVRIRIRIDDFKSLCFGSDSLIHFDISASLPKLFKIYWIPQNHLVAKFLNFEF